MPENDGELHSYGVFIDCIFVVPTSVNVQAPTAEQAVERLKEILEDKDDFSDEYRTVMAAVIDNSRDALPLAAHDADAYNAEFHHDDPAEAEWPEADE